MPVKSTAPSIPAEAPPAYESYGHGYGESSLGKEEVQEPVSTKPTRLPLTEEERMLLHSEAIAI